MVTPAKALSDTTEGAVWKPLYRFAAWGAVAVIALVPIQAAIYFLWPPPTTVSGYFSMFHDNAVVGLLNQDLLLLVDEALMLVVSLALFVALRGANPSWMAVALVGIVVGTALFLASNTAFEMFNLSSKYAAATTDQQRTAYWRRAKPRLPVIRAAPTLSATSSPEHAT